MFGPQLFSFCCGNGREIFRSSIFSTRFYCYKLQHCWHFSSLLFLPTTDRKKNEFKIYYFPFFTNFFFELVAGYSVRNDVKNLSVRSQKQHLVKKNIAWRLTSSTRVVYCKSLISEHSCLQGFEAVSSNGDSRLMEGWYSHSVQSRRVQEEFEKSRFIQRHCTESQKFRESLEFASFFSSSSFCDLLHWCTRGFSTDITNTQ